MAHSRAGAFSMFHLPLSILLVFLLLALAPAAQGG